MITSIDAEKVWPQHNRHHTWQTHRKPHSQWGKTESIFCKIRNKTRMSTLETIIQHTFRSPRSGYQRGEKKGKKERNPNWERRNKALIAYRWHDIIHGCLIAKPYLTCVTHGLLDSVLCPWDFPSKNTELVCHFLLQGIFMTQGIKPRLLHCRQILYWLRYQGAWILYTESPKDAIRKLLELTNEWSKPCRVQN